MDNAILETKAEITQKNIAKLIDDQRAIYEIISEQGEIAPAELYEQYQQRADDPKTERMVRYHPLLNNFWFTSSS